MARQTLNFGHGTPMTVPMAVIVERRTTRESWQPNPWRTTSVDFDFAGGPSFRVLRSQTSSTVVRIGHVPMTLHASQLMGYRLNFANGEPRTYVALHVRDFDADEPVGVDLVTASALELHAYKQRPVSLVDSVAMGPDLLAWVKTFVSSCAPKADTRNHALPDGERLEIAASGKPTLDAFYRR